MSILIEAPQDISILYDRPELISLFLAGSIENGKADGWQDKLCFQFRHFDDLVILNPRRKDWNPDVSGNELRKQIRWEQKGLDVADLSVFYFDPKTKSPVTLLELGTYLGSFRKSKSTIVFCPETYFRFENVKITCEEFYGVKVYTDYMEFVISIVNKINQEKLNNK